MKEHAEWLAFSYSLPSGQTSSPRVTLWRRLRRLGAITLTGSTYILPARDECIEAFQWLAQEIRHAEGDAVIMHVASFAGFSHAEIVAHFQEARRKEYQELTERADNLLAARDAQTDQDTRDALDKLRRRYADILRTDYFRCPEGIQVAAQLDRIAQVFVNPSSAPEIASAAIAKYRSSLWVTRPRPHIDRLACAWLIRGYINPQASIRYSETPDPGEIAFDMVDAPFSHQGNLCTFETMLHTFGLHEPALIALAEIVHEIDVRDGRYDRPEIAGVDAIVAGWLYTDWSDTEREQHGIALFEGLYQAHQAIEGAHRS
jgi:hypothetical protein